MGRWCRVITTILFDFFDVIRVDPYKKWLDTNNYSREGYWYDIAAQYDRGMISRTEFIAGLSKESAIHRDDIDAAFKGANIFDRDVIELIRTVQKTYKTGLLSNSGGPGLRSLLKEENLEEIFHEIIISGEVGFIKPERAIFEIALDRLDAVSGETIFIDDNPQNVEGANSVGIQGVLFTGYKKLTVDLKDLGINWD